jgi:hypothetical protein
MARDGVNAEIARQREAELSRRAARHVSRLPTPRSKAPARPQEALTIRLAAADDRRELDLLARLDGAGVPHAPSLIAELGGRPVAAMSLFNCAVIADPREATSDVVELLRLRAAQLLGKGGHRWLPLSAVARLSRTLARARAL